MVFDTVLVKQEDRFESYMRCLGALNIDYSTDRIAFWNMTRAKTVLVRIPAHELAESIYKVAVDRAGKEDGNLVHQMALYELNRDGGSLMDAWTLMARAATLRPYDISIKHSSAELHLRLAEAARTGLQRETHLREATMLCRDYNRKSEGDTYGYVTLAKVGLMRLTEALENPNAVVIEQAIKEVEQTLQDGLQRSPADSYLRSQEAKLAELIADSDRAIAALQKAFQTNQCAGFIAIRLARLYQRKTEPAKAKATLEAALAANGNDAKLHYEYAKLLRTFTLHDADRQTRQLPRNRPTCEVPE
jgi:tetratricopeptide (TPR) repeat protein